MTDTTTTTATTTDELVARYAHLAATEIERCGLTKRQLCDPDTGAICSLGAIIRVANRHPDLYGVMVALEVDLESVVGGDYIGWTDADERAEAEVVDAFRTVEKRALIRIDADT